MWNKMMVIQIVVGALLNGPQRPRKKAWWELKISDKPPVRTALKISRRVKLQQQQQQQQQNYQTLNLEVKMMWM